MPRVLVALLCLTTSAWGQESSPTFEPVPAGLLQGQRLVLEEDNAVMAAPEGGWKWMTSRASAGAGAIKATVFVCVHPEDARRFMFAVTEGSSISNESRARGYADGACDSAAAKALGLSVVSVEPSDIPIAGKSFRIEYRGRTNNADQIPIRWVTYVTGSDRTYSISFMAPKDTWQEGEVEFKEFVASFRFIKDPPPAPARSTTAARVVLILGLGLALLGMLAFGACAGLAETRKGAAKNAGAVGCVALLFSFLVPVLIMPSLMAPGADTSKSAEAYGAAFGSTLCVGLIPAVILGLVLWSVVRRAPPSEFPGEPPSNPFEPPQPPFQV